MMTNAHATTSSYSLRRLASLLLVALFLVAACNRNEPTPTPTPVTSQEGGVASVTQQRSTPNAPSGEANSDEPTPQPTATPLTGRVVLWHSWAQAEGDALAAILEQLKASQPGLQIDTLFVAPDDLVASYAAAVSAGSGPDLVLAPNWWLSDLVAANAILKLDRYISGDLDTVYWPASVATMRHNNALYGFPLTAHLVALYVNTTLAPVGDTSPTTGALLATARADPTAGIGIYATLFHTYWGFPAYGAQLFGENNIATLDQSSGSAAYLAWLNTLNTTPGSYVNSDYGMLLDRFKKGEFAYLVDGPWAMADLRAALGDSIAVASLPSGPEGPAQPWLYSDGLFVNPTLSPQQQTIALTVAYSFSTSEAGSLLASVGGLLPAARNVDISSTPLLQGFATQATNAIAMPTGPEMNNVWTYGGDMIIKSLAGVAEPSAIVVETTTLINEANNK